MFVEQPASQDSDVADNAASEDLSQAAEGQDENLNDADLDSEEQTGEEEEQDEIEVDGKKFALPKSAAEKLKAERMMQADYTRKTQDLAEQRKSFEVETQKTREGHQAYLNEYAKVVAIDQQLEEYGKVDWAALIDQDPALAQKLEVKRRELEGLRVKAAEAVTQKQQQFALNEQQETAKRVQEAQAYVAREIPGWSGGRDVALAQYAVSNGMNAQEIGALAVKHPQLLKFMHKAELYDQLEKKRSAKPAAAAAPIKPATQITAARTGTQRDPNKMSTAEWMAHRNSQLHKKR
jgi:hypothetical protein